MLSANGVTVRFGKRKKYKIARIKMNKIKAIKLKKIKTHKT